MPKSFVDPEPQPVFRDAAPADQPAFSFLDVLTTLVRRKWFILAWAFGLGVACTAFSYALKPQFTATTTLLPPQSSAGSSTALLAQLGSAGGALGSLGAGSLGLKNPQEMYVSLMKSDTVENAILYRFHLPERYHETHLSIARRTLEHSVSIDLGAKDGLIRVAVTNTDPALAAAIANAYVDEYRRLSEHLAVSEAGQRRLFFEQQLQTEKEKLAEAEESLKQTEQTTGLVEMDAQARALVQSASTLRAQVAAKEVQIASQRTYQTENNPAMLQAQQELASLRSQLSKLGGNTSDDNLLVSKGQLPAAGLDYVRKVREVKYNETLFEILARQFEAAKLDEAKEGAPIQVIDAAAVPDRKTFPPRPTFLLVGLIAGLLGSCIYVVLQEGLAEDAATNARWQRFKRALAGQNA